MIIQLLVFSLSIPNQLDLHTYEYRLSVHYPPLKMEDRFHKEFALKSHYGSLWLENLAVSVRTNGDVKQFEENNTIENAIEQSANLIQHVHMLLHFGHRLIS